ncbi:nitronate monooxygenase [Paenibacillus sp. FSL K6-2862]|uniref:nitronate monooxygenase n=1 Tax=Paenibacillus sp. FSL K6-2862 TaxID=2921484 RepID=UPI0030F69BFC
MNYKATGGIVDKRTVNAAFSSDAEGVYLSTRVIATKDSPASDVTKHGIIKHGSKDLILLKTPKCTLFRTTSHTSA